MAQPTETLNLAMCRETTGDERVSWSLNEFAPNERVSVSLVMREWSLNLFFPNESVCGCVCVCT